MASLTHSLDLELSSTQYAYVNDNADISVTGDITIEAWIKIEQLPSTAGTIFSIFNKDRNDQRSYSLVMYPTIDELKFLYFDASANMTREASDNAFVVAGDVGNWVHLAVTADVSAKDVILYKNGSSVDSTLVDGDSTSIKDGTVPLFIGCRNYYAAEPDTYSDLYDGKIFDVRLWNDVRTAEEIDDNKCVDIANDSAGLVGRWLFNNDATDSCKSSDLTLVGSPSYSEDVPACYPTGGARRYYSPGIWR